MTRLPPEQLAAGVLGVAGMHEQIASDPGRARSDGRRAAQAHNDGVETTHDSQVSCNGCTACCKRDVVILTREEAPRFRSHIEWHNGREWPVLDRKANGDCVYLSGSGCSIHGSAPGICQRMDCRELYRDTSPEKREARVRQNPQMIHIYTAGAERLHTLER